VVAALGDQPARNHEQRLAPEPAAVERGREEDVQAAVSVVGVGLLVPADPARDLAVDQDRERVLIVDGRVRAPPLAYVGLGDDRVQGFDVGGLQRPQGQAFAHERRGAIGTGHCGQPYPGVG